VVRIAGRKGGCGGVSSADRSRLPRTEAPSVTEVITAKTRAMLPRPLQSAPTMMGGSATPINRPKIEKNCRQPDTVARSRSSVIISGNSAVQIMTSIVQNKSKTSTTAMKYTKRGVSPPSSSGAGGTHRR